MASMEPGASHRSPHRQPSSMDARDAAGVVFGVMGHMMAAVLGLVLITLGVVLSLTFVGLGPGLPLMFVGGLLLIRSMIWHHYPRNHGVQSLSHRR